jgi:3-(3-hydroxy-phenyl)propionate hydroxylase
MDPVIIVGAGPVGLSLALALARQDVPTVVLDEGTGLCPEGPRSTVLRPDTAALLARIGYPRVAGDACAWTAWRTMRRRSQLLHMPLENGEALHLAQHRLQRGLRDAAEAAPLVELVPESRVTEIEQDETGVAVLASGTWWRGSHLVGCDGRRSAVRKLLGLRFPGRALADRYAVATVRAELPIAGEARLHRDPPFDPGTREVAVRPLPDHIWRLDWRLPRTAPPGPLPADELVARVRAALAGWNDGDVPPYEMISSADRPVPQRLATRFRVGRAFLAGDAAHLLGALGMQNLDEGLRDADNLAWKLGLVWHHHAPESLLDSYQRERRGSVIARLRAVDQALPLLHPASPMREARRTLLSGSLRRHALLLSDGSLGTGRLGGAPAYPLLPGDPSVRGGAAALSADLPPTETGVLAQDVEVIRTDGTRDRLRARLGRGLLVVLVAPGTDVWASEHWLGAGLMPGLSEATRALPVPAELLVTGAYPGAAPHTVLLVRPDGHLAAALHGLRPDELWQAADRTRGGTESLPAPRGANPDADADAHAEADEPRGRDAESAGEPAGAHH